MREKRLVISLKKRGKGKHLALVDGNIVLSANYEAISFCLFEWLPGSSALMAWNQVWLHGGNKKRVIPFLFLIRQKNSYYGIRGLRVGQRAHSFLRIVYECVAVSGSLLWFYDAAKGWCCDKESLLTIISLL